MRVRHNACILVGDLPGAPGEERRWGSGKEGTNLTVLSPSYY